MHSSKNYAKNLNSSEAQSTSQVENQVSDKTISSPTAQIIQRARISPRSLAPQDVLQLQRTIGNKAVGKLFTKVAPQTPKVAVAAPVSPPLAANLETVDSPAIQRLVTITGANNAVAEKLYKNHQKGDPPFKPQRGNFGKVSWFKGKNNPNIGAQAQNYTVTIDVNIAGTPRFLDESYFKRILGEWTHEGGNASDPGQRGDFWRYLARKLESENLAEVAIPFDRDLNNKEAGTFITANSSARDKISLANPVKLAADIGAQATAINQNLAQQSAAKGNAFTISLASVSADITRETLIADLKLADNPQITPVSRTANPVNPGQAQGWAGRVTGGKPNYTIVLTVTYNNYLTARRNAKLLNTNQLQTLQTKYGNVTITGGTGWRPTATRSYKQIY